MDRFIGLDVHASSCTFAVLGPSGKRLRSRVVEMNGQALVSFLKTIPGTLHLCLEECTQSSWLAEVLGPHVHELVVIGVGQRSRRGQKDDARDAFALADRLRKSDVPTVVYKQVGPYAAMRQLVKVHAQLARDVVRVQNRIRALFRSRGVRCADKTVYGTRHRATFVAQLPWTLVPGAEHLYAQYDALVPAKAAVEKALVEEAHRHAITRVLETCPGLGPRPRFAARASPANGEAGREESTMARNRSMGETTQRAIRLPVELLARIERHVERLRRRAPGLSISVADAIRSLLTAALDREEASDAGAAPRKKR